jgi:hypothetical protein
MQISSLLEVVEKLVEENKQLWKAIEGINSDIAADRRKLKVVGEQPKEAIYKTEAHLTRLQTYLSKPDHHGVTFSTAAKVLGLSRGRISQMSEVIRGDKRFKIIKHPTRSNTWVITLSREISNVKTVSSVLTPQEDM